MGEKNDRTITAQYQCRILERINKETSEKSVGHRKKIRNGLMNVVKQFDKKIQQNGRCYREIEEIIIKNRERKEDKQTKCVEKRQDEI